MRRHAKSMTPELLRARGLPRDNHRGSWKLQHRKGQCESNGAMSLLPGHTGLTRQRKSLASPHQACWAAQHSAPPLAINL